MRLKDKVVIVTGGTQGIGEAVVRVFAAEGARVVFSGRRREPGEALQAALRDAGLDARFVQGDVACAEDLDRLVSATLEGHGGVDVLVNNAGVGYMKPFLEVPEADWDATMDVNLKSAMRLGQRVLPSMLARGGGSIVNIASLAAILGGPGFCTYSASKAALCGLTRALAGEFGRAGVRVNAILPGSIDTPMFEREIDDRQKGMLSMMTPMGRLGRPEEIAKVALFLASDDASYMTGQSLCVDGGFTLM